MYDEPREYTPNKPFRMDQYGCARCHGPGHGNLLYTPFTHPVLLDCEPPFTHWATCPETGEPILLQSRPTDDEPVISGSPPSAEDRITRGDTVSLVTAVLACALLAVVLIAVVELVG